MVAFYLSHNFDNLLKASSTDTLSSIAARFETTPSELAKINRLTSRHIFPGQVFLRFSIYILFIFFF